MTIKGDKEPQRNRHPYLVTRISSPVSRHSSIRPGASALDHLAQLVDLGPDMRGEFFGLVADHDVAQVPQALAHVRIAHRRNCRSADRRDRLFRRFNGRQSGN